MTDPRTLAEEAKIDNFLGWWCQRPGGYVFHTDPVDGCPGPHVGCYSWPADTVLRLLEENEKLREVLAEALGFVDELPAVAPRHLRDKWRTALTETPEREG